MHWDNFLENYSKPYRFLKNNETFVSAIKAEAKSYLEFDTAKDLVNLI